MDTNITQSGYSFYVLIPKNFVEYFELKNGDKAKIEIKGNEIIITIPTKVTIEQVVEEHTREA